VSDLSQGVKICQYYTLNTENWGRAGDNLKGGGPCRAHGIESRHWTYYQDSNHLQGASRRFESGKLIFIENRRLTAVILTS
jgi:hypothetical protein